MRHVMAVEIKTGIWNLRFLCGVLVIFTAALITGRPHIRYLIESGGSAEGPGWFVAYLYCSNAFNTLLFIPIAVTFAAGGNAESELRSRYALFCCIRSGRKAYLIGKAAELIVTGGLMVCLAFGMVLAVACMWVENLPMIGENAMKPAIFLSDTGLRLLCSFLNGALWALVGGFAAVVTRNRYLAYAVPFILYYVLTMFQERYYQAMFFLSPRYWAAPIYYRPFFCIALLSVLCILVSILFMKAVKRRLADG